MRPLSAGVVVFAVVCLAAGVARADVLTLSPVDAQAEAQDGTTWVLDQKSAGLNASRFSSGLQRRGIMEFDLSGLPAGSTITGASFGYAISQYTYGSSYPNIEFHGYTANGVMEGADATRAFNLLGSSGLITAAGARTTSLSAGAVQSLYAAGGTSPWLGMWTYQATLDRQASFYSTDATYVPAGDRPRLTLTYTPPPSKNIYVTGADLSVREYTQAGALVRTVAVPYPGTRDAAEEVRGTAVDHRGRVHVYNGTFAAYVSTYDPATGAWEHRTDPGLSVVNNGSYGAVASVGSYVFASDMATAYYGPTPPAAPNGLVRFNTAAGGGGAARAGGSLGYDGDVSRVTRGLDGLVYTLSGGGTEKYTVRGYNPYTMAAVRTVTLREGVRGIVVNAAGTIYGTTWDGRVHRFGATGAAEKSLAVAWGASGIDLAADGTIVIGTWTNGVYLTSEVLASATQVVGGQMETTFVTFAQPAPQRGWKANAQGAWSAAGNWEGGVPGGSDGGAGSIAVFGPAINSARTVTVDASQTVGTIALDSAHAYTLSGGAAAAAVTLDVPAGQRGAIHVAQGAHTLATKVVLADDATMTTAAGARLTVQTLFGAPAGRIDIGGHDLIWDYAAGESPAEAVRGYLKSGRNATASAATTPWSGPGIVSSVAAADGQGLTGIGWAEASALGVTSFGGAAVDGSALVLAARPYGDADLSGAVTADDYLRIDRGRAMGLAGWVNGDFDYSGVVDSGDYLLIDRVFASQSGGLSAEFLAQREAQFGSAYVVELVAGVPEPGAVAGIAGAAFVLGCRRRRGI